MYQDSNLTFDRKAAKCAQIVGDVMGRYHPHGDSAIYEAMVRLSQEWVMRLPLVHGEGNVLHHRQPREEAVVLKDESAFGPWAFNCSPIEKGRTGIWRQQSGEDRHQRRFPGAAVANDGDELTLLNREIHVVEHGGVAEAFANLIKFKQGHKNGG